MSEPHSNHSTADKLAADGSNAEEHSADYQLKSDKLKASKEQG